MTYDARSEAHAMPGFDEVCHGFRRSGHSTTCHIYTAALERAYVAGVAAGSGGAALAADCACNAELTCVSCGRAAVPDTGETGR